MPELLKIPAAVPSNPIYGRQKELKFIAEKLEQQECKSSKLLLIEGAAGIGKTSLIKKALEHHKKKKCFKLYGKFENQRENIPYLGIRRAFSQWSNQILLLSDGEFEKLRETATSSLQSNIYAITSIFSELEVFFSRKHLLAKMRYIEDSHQVRSRFYYFLKKFLKSITSLDFRLVIFLDDLQWADRASLILLEELICKEDLPGLMFITAYRPLPGQDSFIYNKTETFKDHRNATYIILKPLKRQAINKLIPETWNFTKTNRDAFSKYLWLESRGNPFKINHILKSVNREKLRSREAENNPLFWENLPKLGNGKDETGFVRERLSKLPFQKLKTIASASCLGYYFDSALLKQATGYSQAEVDRALSALVKLDYLIDKKNFYVFSHDTIFTAADSLLSGMEKSEIHQKTGAYLLAGLQNYEQTRFFKAVNHLNRARELSGAKESPTHDHILLNIQAGRLAIRNSAFEAANQYFLLAQELLGTSSGVVGIKDPELVRLFETSAIEDEDLKFYILFGFAETNFLLQKFEQALGFAHQVMELKSSRHQKILATLIKIRICSALIYQRNIRPILLDGLNSLEQVLSEFNINLPSDPEKIRKETSEDCRLIYEKASGYKLDQDFSKFVNPDKEYQDLLKLITTSMTFLYYMDVRKNTYMAIKTLLMCMDKGYAPVTPILFSASFLTSTFSEQNKSLAHVLGKISLKMIEKEPFKRYSHVVYYVATLNFFAWENHYRICIEKLQESVQHALEAGDPHYASFCSTNIRMLNTYRGKNLQKHLLWCQNLGKNFHIFFISSSDDALAKYLTGEKPGFENGEFEFPPDLILESEHNLSSRYHLNLARQKLYYFSGYTQKGIEAGEVCENLENVYSGFQIELEHYFFYSLVLLRAAFEQPALLERSLKIIQPKLAELRRLSNFKSGNYQHKVWLIEAEIAKCNGDFENATGLYDLAIQEAKAQKFIHHAAMAAELAFEYYLLKKRKEIAGVYFKKSIKLYKKWGAYAKVAQLQKKYSGLAENRVREKKRFLPDVQYAVIKEIISKTIPGKKITPAELGEYLINILVKEGRAKKGVILTWENSNWKVLSADKTHAVICGKSLGKLGRWLPAKVLNYAIKKGEKIIFQDISGNSLFSEERYFRKNPFENLTVFPVKQGAETLGLIYLEDSAMQSEAEKDLFLVMLELATTTFANAIYNKNNDLLNKELKLQERNRIEAVIESQEKERQRIAGELHDSLGQMLALIKIKISCLYGEKAGFADKKPRLEILSLLDESCDELRAISHNLMPPDIEGKSLEEILGKLIKKNSAKDAMQLDFFTEGIGDLSVAIKLTLYRVLQEIIQNILKHAFASKVTVILTQTEDMINLVVEDNGKGFDKHFTSMGLGLKNIYSRVKLLDGYLDIDSSIDNGTVFNVSIPLNAPYEQN